MTESRIITDEQAVAELELWEMEGHNPLHAIRIFELPGGLIAGVTDHMDETLLIPQSLNEPSMNYSELFAKIGALFDEMEEA